MSLAMPPSSFDNLLAVRRCCTELDVVGSEAESQSDGRFSGQSGPSAPAGPWQILQSRPTFTETEQEPATRERALRLYRSGPMCSRFLRNRQAPRLWPVCRVLLMHRDVDRRRMQSLEHHRGSLTIVSANIACAQRRAEISSSDSGRSQVCWWSLRDLLLGREAQPRGGRASSVSSVILRG
jgi:hypothetical protein